jgi:predicted dithiol-disulfide oxidoreductase (DUF899 family)
MKHLDMTIVIHLDRPGRPASALAACARRGRHLGVYPWLDRAPKGRNESGLWWRRHDEYDQR